MRSTAVVCPRILLLAAATVVVASLAGAQPAGGPHPPNADGDDAWEAVLAWPESQRAFYQDGPGWLLDDVQRAELRAMDEAARERWITGFLAADPIPETPGNELTAAIAARRAGMFAELPSPTDVRARLLFLHGPPTERLVLDCGLTFRPLEIWTWGDPEAPQSAGDVHSVLVFQDPAAGAWRLWLPPHGKRVLYTREMEFWLEEWEELVGGGLLRARRFDLQACRETRRVDRLTGVRGLTDAERDRPRAEDFLAWLAPPRDLASWARAATTAPPAEASLEIADLEVRFPAREGQLMTTRLIAALAPGAATPVAREGRLAAGAEEAWAGAFAEGGAGAEGEEDAVAADAPGVAETPATSGEATSAAEPVAAGAAGESADDDAAERELRLVVEGLMEKDGGIFESFRVRFRPDAPEASKPLALVLDRALRPNASYLVRLAVRDEVSGRVGRIAGAVVVPAEPRPEDATRPIEDLVVALGDDLAREPIAGADHLLLVPPEETVVLGLWRAEALVSGTRIERVAFLVDGVVQLTRSRPPFTAELRLDRFPREQVIGAAGYDAAGELVAADEVVVNQPRGELRVRIVEPARGLRAIGRTTTRVEVTVPDGRRVERVEIEINEQPVAVLERPPWEAEVDVPGGDQVIYLTAVAWLDDGRRAEDVRVLNAPGFSEQVDVALLELYVAALDRDNRPVPGLVAGEFRVLEDGRPQQVRRFEEVRDLPLGIGLVIDTSGSMESSLSEAQRAAEGFLRGVVRPGDVSFAVAFSNRPALLVPPTDDVDAVADALSGLRADGSTALHDALVTALYYFRGLEGQKALVLLSDGDDTASGIPYQDALEYARRMNTAVYPIGLGVGVLDVPIRRKLDELARSTGGRSFYISQASELDDVYDRIEQELRTRYLLAYSSDHPAGEGDEDEFRRVEVEISRPGVSARTIRGYYP